MQERVPAKSTSGTGDSAGAFTVASTAGFAAGAKGFIRKSDNSLNQYCMIAEILSATKFSIRFLPEGINDTKLRTGAVKHPYYGVSDLSAYTAGSIFSYDAQLVDVQQPVAALQTVSNL